METLLLGAYGILIRHINSPPSPEGELMETFFNLPCVEVEGNLYSPPSPEGELMETLASALDPQFLVLVVLAHRLRLKEN